ncbi:NADP-dependent oxidoreductase [Phytomonospora endophytica]|uniref:NADPH:quinone reductase-like Zn-dependent oxidoreductase n=1 Tax=Phytomonospora endophytica TaxID=714109 RepID=A0A841FU12_9ACTN|nr:NADP-dependent oxidoreductase [Phytomonospora endophytica]MBB6037228.1 NADPH:quinone reductase-like Zn-dependent oxidoreductase [Phytomonospora endophytica]GIG71270.1 NADPH:quinone reductase [Phytomonospora endophytica]
MGEKTMRAVVLRSYGGPEALEAADVALPEAGDGQVRVRIEAIGVHVVDAVIRRGFMAEREGGAGLEYAGLGHDAAGTVDAIGAGVPGLAVGDRVIGLHSALVKPLGTYAEYAVFDAVELAPVPKGLDAVTAATLPSNGLTALQALRLLDLGEGATLLVTGAAGSLGGFAVQLAAARGIEVIGLASAADEAAVRALGARGFVARDTGIASGVREVAPSGVDGVLDAAMVGQEAVAAAADGGVYVQVTLPGEARPERGVRVVNVWCEADPGDYAELVSMVERGVLTPRVLATYPLAEAAAAHERLDRGGLRGRLVLLP